MGEVPIKFDNMEVDDTQLAEAYLNQKSELEFIFLTEGAFKFNSDFRDSLRLLAKRLEEYMELFAQLELLKRGVPKEDTYRDIKLIVQHLNLKSYASIVQDVHRDCEIIIGEKTPLWYLRQSVQNNSLISPMTRIICCETTAAVCSLFAKLARVSGSSLISVEKREDPLKHKKSEYDGCLGVITEKSDLESAVDIFMTSSSTSKLEQPWTLRRILVQESVYEKFKKALSSRNGCRSTEASDGDNALLSSDIFNFEQKLILLDFVGSVNKINDTKQVILVEAYRTVKELLSLVANYQPFSLSLWCSDISEANEIAYGVNVPITWINDYKNFDGPTISCALYSRMNSIYLEGDDAKKIDDAYTNWFKMSFNERLEEFKKATDKFGNQIENEQVVLAEIGRDLRTLQMQPNNFKKATDKFGNQIENEQVVLAEIGRALRTLQMQPNNLIEIEKGKLWVEINRPNRVTFKYLQYDHEKIFDEFIINVLRGNILLYEIGTRYEYAKILKFYEEEGIPVFNARMFKLNETPKTKNFVEVSSCLYETRIICTTFGSIFAN